MKVEDFTKAFMSGIKSLKKYETLVGVPAEKSNRQDDGINNATILAINEFGSPANNIPSRPVLTIGLRLASDAVTNEMKNAILVGLKKGGDAVLPFYERAGLIASQSVKNVINNQIDIEGPAASTLEGRARRGFKGNKALIVSGQLRNSITWVVKGK